MTIINTDYSNTELLDQELNLEELVEVSGGDYYPGQRSKYIVKSEHSNKHCQTQQIDRR